MRRVLFILLNLILANNDILTAIVAQIALLMLYPFMLLQKQDSSGIGWLILAGFVAIILVFILKLCIFAIIYKFKNKFSYTAGVLQKFITNKAFRNKVLCCTIATDAIMFIVMIRYDILDAIVNNILLGGLTICYLAFWIWAKFLNWWKSKLLCKE